LPRYKMGKRLASHGCKMQASQSGAAGRTRWGNLSTVQTRQQRCKSDKRRLRPK
jgi:hypothetical protein